MRFGPLLIGTSALLSLALLAGRLAGFVRELMLASAFGVSQQADAAVLLLTLPDLLVNLLLSGGLSVALIPVLRSSTPQQAASLFVQASLAVAFGFGLLALAIGLTPVWWLGALAPGAHFSSSASAKGVLDQVYLVALAVPLTALSGVSTAYLNSRDRFFVAGCGTLLFNLCVIAGLVASHRAGGPIFWLCMGILSGALVRWLGQLAVLPGAVWHWHRTGLLLDRRLLRAFGAAFMASSLMLLVPVIVRAMASVLGEGAIASFNYASKLIELPVGILITTLATVAFPKLSELHAGERAAEAAEVLGSSLRRSAVLSTAVLLTGLWFAEPVVSLLFLRGRIDGPAIQQITLLTQVALLSVPFVGVSSLAAAALNARHRTSLVLWNTLACLALLPLLAAPGLWWHSPAWLMSSVVGFQALLAVALMRSAGLRWVGGAGWLDRRMPGSLSRVAGMAAICFTFDRLAGLQDPRWRAALAVATFLLAALAGVRHLSKAPSQPGSAVNEKID